MQNRSHPTPAQLRSQAEALGLRQSDIARAVGCDQGQVSRLLSSDKAKESRVYRAISDLLFSVERSSEGKTILSLAV